MTTSSPTAPTLYSIRIASSLAVTTSTPSYSAVTVSYPAATTSVVVEQDVLAT